MTELNFRILNAITWEKTNPPPNLGRRCFTHSTELVIWATKAPKGSKHKHTFHYDEMRADNGGKQMKSVWQFQAAGRNEKRFGKHPTQKPVALIDRCLRASTNPDDIVFDPFAGTAATGVAALDLGRRFCGVERDEEYAHIGRQRLIEVESRRDSDFAFPQAAGSQSQTRLLENAPKYHPATN